MKYIRKISDYAIAGGIGALVIVGMQGCEQKGEDNAFTKASQTQGAFVVIEESAPGAYKIVDEYPSATTRVILRSVDGSERILTDAELDELVKKEAQKIDAGTSGLTNPSMHSGAPGLGEVLLASAAGAVIGSWIGGKLFNSANYQQRRQTAYKSPQTYSRSVTSFNKAATSSTKASSTKKGGFFSNFGKKTTGSSSFFGG